MSPDTQTYNHLLAGLAKSGQLGRAAQVFEDMRAEGLRPDSFTATVMLEVRQRLGLMYEIRRTQEDTCCGSS